MARIGRRWYAAREVLLSGKGKEMFGGEMIITNATTGKLASEKHPGRGRSGRIGWMDHQVALRHISTSAIHPPLSVDIRRPSSIRPHGPHTTTTYTHPAWPTTHATHGVQQTLGLAKIFESSRLFPARRGDYLLSILHLSRCGSANPPRRSSHHDLPAQHDRIPRSKVCKVHDHE